MILEPIPHVSNPQVAMLSYVESIKSNQSRLREGQPSEQGRTAALNLTLSVFTSRLLRAALCPYAEYL